MLNAAKANKAARLSEALRVRNQAAAALGPSGSANQLPPLPHPDVLTEADFEGDASGADRTGDLFNSMYNVEHIRQKLRELEAVIVSAKADGKDPAVVLADCHLVFTGPPGTGKTTVARKFGQLFKAQGLLPTDTVIITSGTDVQGQYVGETKGKVAKLMDQARGGILLIDEAYGLTPGKGNYGYAVEAIDTLVAMVTQEEYKGNLVVILAGYEDKMDELFRSVNPGFRSRFDKHRVAFPPWTGAQAAQVALCEVDKDGKTMTPEAAAELGRCFTDMARDASWASARDVLENILPKLYTHRATRLVSLPRGAGPAAPPPYEAVDVLSAFEHALGERVLQVRVCASARPR